MRVEKSLKRTILLMLIFGILSAQNFLFALKVPTLKGRVNDYANIIDSSDEEKINQILKNVEDQTGAQIAVLTVQSLEDESLEEFSLKVAETWKLGQKDKDNGVLLLVSMDEHAIRIETGYGAEEFLTDAKCGLIIRNVIVPQFQKGKYSEGIYEAVKNMGGLLLQDETLVEESVLNNKENSNTADMVYVILAIILMFIIITIRASRVSRFGPRIYTPIPGSTLHTGGSSGFSGGSFSGGGGHFGGGGASGHW